MEEEDYRCDSEVEADSDHEDHEETLEHHGGWLGNNLVHFHMVSVSRLLGVITPFHTMSLHFHLLSAEVLCMLCHYPYTKQHLVHPLLLFSNSVNLLLLSGKSRNDDAMNYHHHRLVVADLYC